ncbi:MAG TPA: hypothetical protein VKA46_10000 [Gemmataceae bacterium]|nr:hypothetical protein [Gemmataceae bacterium]
MSTNPANTNQPAETDLFPRPITEEEVRELDALLGESVPPLIAGGRKAFLRDLPQLLKTHRGWCVAYSGDRRLGISRSALKLYDECFRQGLARTEFIVLDVEESHFYTHEIEILTPELDE